MNRAIYTLPINKLADLNLADAELIRYLESGQVLFLPNYSFVVNPENSPCFSTSILGKHHKNISYNFNHDNLSGLANHTKPSIILNIQHFMRGFANYSRELLNTLLPHYKTSLQWGRTSFRPMEIDGRKSSRRKDDTRLHVDAFPATPVNGLRILRVFCNINPYQQPRIWNLGESFATVLATFAGSIPPFNPKIAKLLHWLKATKSLRSPYDHYMLKLHDQMKLDNHYQKTVTKKQVSFPANSTWIVFTDQVSHAAISGQYLLEQTFYLPVNAMIDPSHSPLKQWEQYKQQRLI
ncbi:MAG: Kdo hydroxylase family protein [Legionella sp.]